MLKIITSNESEINSPSLKLDDTVDSDETKENLFGTKATSNSLSILSPSYLKLQSSNTLIPGVNGSPPVTTPFQMPNQFLGSESSNNWPLIQSKIESLNE